MITLKRGTTFYIDGSLGGRRLRGSLGTSDKSAASRLRSRLELAVAEGPRSENWVGLRRSLPSSTYARFAKASGLRVSELPTWGGLLSVFWTDRGLAANTIRRYEAAAAQFSEFLTQEYDGPDTPLSDITGWVLDQYKMQRRGRISANTLNLETVILHAIFKVGTERHLVSRNPVKLDGRATESKVEPFTGAELTALREACVSDTDKLLFAVLRYTGLRVSDVADLRWSNVHFLDKVIRRRCIKNGREVEIPMADDLAQVLGATTRDEYVITEKNNCISTGRIRYLLRLIERKAKIANVHPHRFRHTMACDLLVKGCSPYEVGQMLGDTTTTVEKTYLSFVAPLQAKVKKLMDDSSKGLEANRRVL